MLAKKTVVKDVGTYFANTYVDDSTHIHQVYLISKSVLISRSLRLSVVILSRLMINIQESQSNTIQEGRPMTNDSTRDEETLRFEGNSQGRDTLLLTDMVGSIY